MGLHLPGGGEIATATILATHPEMAALVLTMHSDDTHLRHALNAGARGYQLKDAEPDTIIRALIAVKEGQAIFDRCIAAQLIAATGTSHAERPIPCPHPSANMKAWTGSPEDCPTTRCQPGWASASRQCKTTYRPSCSSLVPPTAPRPSP
jgi:DNA-binding NarL/FixJ family response regulator